MNIAYNLPNVDGKAGDWKHSLGVESLNMGVLEGLMHLATSDHADASNSTVSEHTIARTIKGCIQRKADTCL